jgi:hypothetical protein
MGKFLLLHLLVVAAGWGVVAMLTPVVPAGWIGGQIAAESRAPAKSGVRTLTAADTAAGQKLLQRVTAALPKDVIEAGLGPMRSFEELIDESRRLAGFDPAAPAPPWYDESRTPEGNASAREYHVLLSGLLEARLNGEHGPDLAYAFRHGRVDAPALYESLALQLPGAATNEALRIALYRHLAPLDPARAASLLDALSEDAATDLKFETASLPQSPLTPDTTFGLLFSIPQPTEISGVFRRQSAWDRATHGFQESSGSDLLHWVEELPAGADRDCAAVALMVAFRESDLPGYRRMRALVSDARRLDAFPPR